MLGNSGKTTLFSRQASAPQLYVLWQVTDESRVGCAALCSRDRRCHSFASVAENQTCVGLSDNYLAGVTVATLYAEDNPGKMIMSVAAKGKML